MSNYQIKLVDPKTQNFSLKYKVFSWIGNASKTEKDNSIFLKKEGYKFIKYEGNLKLPTEDIAILLNDYFGNYMPNKKLVIQENIYV